MSDHLTTYIQDHLSGASFAVSLLQDLSQQNCDADVARLAAALHSTIEEDRQVLEDFAKQIGADPSAFKDATAWLTQKVSRLKLALNTPFGVFEAIEMLSLGVLGKLGLWSALEAARESDSRINSLDLARLSERAREQHEQLESRRLTLAARTLPATED